MTKSRSILTGIVLGLFVMVACLFGFAGCGATITGIDIELSTNAVKQGETLDLSSLKVKLVKSDKSSTEIASTEYEISAQPDTSKLGVQQLTVKYKNNDNTYTKSMDIWVYGAFDKISVDESSYPEKIYKGEAFDKNSLVIYAEYKCDETKGNYKKILDTSSDTLVITDLDTTVVGERTVTITYTNGTETGEAEIKITIVGYEVTGFIAPANITNYNSQSKNKNTYTTTDSKGTKGFEVVNTDTETNYTYKVGSYNTFWFKPTLKTQDPATYETKDLTEFPMSATVYIYNESTKAYVKLTDADYSTYVQKYDTDKHSFQFTKTAEGKKFKIEVYPSDPLSEAEKKLVKTISFEFDVVDGYNIYNAQDLSAIDNANLSGKWTTLKKDWGIDTNVTTNTFILHNNINITKADVPEMHFYTKEEVSGYVDADIAEGSLKDEDDFDKDEYPLASIYRRNVNAGDNTKVGDTFTLEGNYFSISAQNFPLIVREEGKVRTDRTKAITTHTNLISVVCKDESAKDIATIRGYVGEGATEEQFNAKAKEVSAKANFNNLEFLGNSPKTEEALGGVLLYKTLNTYTTFDNCLSQRWFISFYTQRGGAQFSKDGFLALGVKQTNAYDAYNTMVYSSGGSVNIIEGSHLIGAGGPLIISDSVNQQSGGTVAQAYVDESSVMESVIAGTEGWFNTYEMAGTLIASIKAQNEIFKRGDQNLAKKTLEVSAGKLNLISIMKDTREEDGAQIATTYTKEGAIVPFNMGNKFTTSTTADYVLDLLAVTNILNNTDAKTAAESYMDYMQTKGKTVARYQAIKELIAFADTPAPADKTAKELWDAAQTIKTNYQGIMSSDESKGIAQNAVNDGIVYIGSNGMVCVPNLPTKDTPKATWAMAPNAELWAECNGLVYLSIYGKFGGVLTISDYTATE